MTFDPAPRQSVSDHVFGRLRDAVVRGHYSPGDPLPSERELAATFAVNRHAIREALRRLQQLGLVKVSQGGATRVLDWRATAGLDLALALTTTDDVLPVPTIGRDVMEMRACIGADAARLCATRAGDAGRAAITAAAAGYADAAPDLARMAEADLAFWRRIVEASGNVAYLLAFNSLTAGSLAVGHMPAQSRTAELLDVAAHRALAGLIAGGDAAGAERAARALLAVPATEEIGSPRP
ncbi:putative GntR-family transcriptional regulator [Actinoplanes missouriensis 431]|uniref:Putative GntR-family transcriptional regulator n=1 Tax=Actinoplanes missouriensis (strain ATCC 14538 / DSM 43046 / CBS 188.64 / JCM 3121 / NBRC 102363 / NCIMB 12654 / NRRL B-3342 / UNCC 431) TaxID=512565 RepID=I0HA28_ACTM4|nr:GntR family transcriptional regulator [Actinoplanes missouriensis]BAL89865.1 putative GntR-family transcriptional regulator [Actinoplanes missouriensis 431]